MTVDEMQAEIDRLKATIKAAEKLCNIYFTIAEDEIGEEAVKTKCDEMIARLTEDK